MDMERGPRYNAYAKLRETKLQINYQRLQQYQQEQENIQVVQQPTKIPTPPIKQVKFNVGVVSGRKGSSLIAQSVPDFSSMLRKENRKPTNMLPTISSTATLTPPLKNKNKGCGVLSSSRGSSRSANSAAEKKKGVGGGGILMARKSYANFDELRSFSSVTANAINGESTRNSRVVGKKPVLRCREF
ncbi:hypothetical protein TSUD_158680 [Trifolium subterraneum]|uniref:Uncharacterized protein n=1 Tax=Trifolium subterraneum TaxID=3900 RepID=A0A2Z6P5T9_TRISU|nr:hypothetical protein TSUD_158680 [Trifolium subterraneum]